MGTIFKIKDRRGRNCNQEIIHIPWSENEFKSLIRIDNKAGKSKKEDYISLDIQKYNGFSVAKWDSQFTEDLSLSASNADPMMFLHFLQKGKGRFKASNFEGVYAKPGQFNLWNFTEGDYGYSELKKNERYSSLGIYLRQDYIERIVDNYPEVMEKFYLQYLRQESFPIYTNYQKTEPHYQQILGQIQQAYMLGKAGAMYCESKILELLAIQAGSIPTPCKCRRDELKTIDFKEKIYEARRILLSDLNNELDLKKLSDYVGLNDYKLKYGFKKIFGQPVFQYLVKYKMDLAMEYLRETNLSINQVALEVGYDHQSSFCRAFRRWHGVSPRKIRGEK
jgi:AraC-like DNA-binding protein